MQAYICSVCGFLYDDESAEKDLEGHLIPFEALDDEWACPICGTKEDLFKQTESDRTIDITTEDQ